MEWGQGFFCQHELIQIDPNIHRIYQCYTNDWTMATFLLKHTIWHTSVDAILRTWHSPNNHIDAKQCPHYRILFIKSYKWSLSNVNVLSNEKLPCFFTIKCSMLWRMQWHILWVKTSSQNSFHLNSKDQIEFSKFNAFLNEVFGFISLRIQYEPNFFE